MRTNIKSIEHFNNYIERQPKRIERFNEKINAGKVAEDNLASVYRKQFMIGFNTLVAMYSRGDEIDMIEAQFPTLVATMEKGWKDDKEIPADKYQFDDYVLMLHMLSLGVLLNPKGDEFENIINILDESGRKDALFEFLISYKIKNRDNSAEIIMYETPYKKLVTITQNTYESEAIYDLKEFLENKWYSGMRNVYWHDNHKSRHDTFFGYWSFEAAAIAKIKGLNTDELKNNQYFPSDMI